MPTLPTSESDMTAPTLTLFPEADYLRYEQVALGRKSIDLVCLSRHEQFTTTIELKIRDWRRALWQASLNVQVSDESYIAIWELYVHRAESQKELLAAYGVGLISVSASSAKVLLKSPAPARRISRSHKREWYQRLMEVG